MSVELITFTNKRIGCQTKSLRLPCQSHLRRRQECFHQRSFSANGHRRESLVPITTRHFGIGVEPGGQGFEGIRADAALLNAKKRMGKQCLRDVFALDLGIRIQRKNLQ